MADNLPLKDSYLEGRRLEAQARAQNSHRAWLDYAELKASKGSYALAVMGFLNAGSACEAAGDAAAAAAYESGLDIAIKGGLKEPALFLAARLAGLLERSSDYSGAAEVYDRLAGFCEASGAFFLAADAAEHAAEMLLAGGRDISSCRRPAELWLLNAEYWKGRNDGDEAWSRRRAQLYLESIKK